MSHARPDPASDRAAAWTALAIALAPIPIAFLISWALGPSHPKPEAVEVDHSALKSPADQAPHSKGH